MLTGNNGVWLHELKGPRKITRDVLMAVLNSGRSSDHPKVNYNPHNGQIKS